VEPISNLDDLIGEFDSPPIRLGFKCNGCGRKHSGDFDWICMSPIDKPEDEDWDGKVLSRIVKCPKCGAVDDYSLDAKSNIVIIAELLRKKMNKTYRSRLVVAPLQLFDGTPVRRPSQAIAHLRRLVEEQPERAELHLRLGNGLERWGLSDEAVLSWERALELDPDMLEAAYSLADYYWDPDKDPIKGLNYLRDALSGFPKALGKRPELKELSIGLAKFLKRMLVNYEGPMALTAIWEAGFKLKKDPVVNMSAVDLRRLRNFDALADFLCRPGLRVVDLTPELPKDKPTNLERLLNGDESFQGGVLFENAYAPVEPVRSPKKPGRNEPCPCGSGKKYKRCCGK